MKPRDVESLRVHKWTLLGGGILLVALNVWVEHRWLMHMPMVWQHGFQLASNLMLVAMFAAGFNVLLRYERHLALLNARLARHNHQLEELQKTVDVRLIELAQQLSLSLAEVTSQAQLALQRTTDLSDIKVFSRLIDETHAMKAIADELIELKQLEAAPPAGGAAKGQPPCAS